MSHLYALLFILLVGAATLLFGSAVLDNMGGGRRLVTSPPDGPDDGSDDTGPALWTATVVLVLGAVGAITASGQPTGNRAADVVMRVALVAAFVMAARRVPRSLYAVTAVVGVAAQLGSDAVDLAGITMAAVAVGLLFLWWRQAAPADDRRATAVKLLPMVAGATLANALLRLPSDLPARLPSALAGVCTVVVVVAGVVRSRPTVRRRVLLASAAVFVLVVVGGAAAALRAIDARRGALRGMDTARAAISSAENADAALAANQFEDAAAQLRSAHRTLRSPLTLVGRVIPVVAQNLASAESLTRSGAAVAGDAAAAVATVDFTKMRTDDGGVDVTRIAALRAPIAKVQLSVDAALASVQGAQGPWVAPTVSRQARSLELELLDAQRSTQDASLLVDAVPELLGLNGPRRYLLVVPSPAEARGSGGLVGNYGEIAADGGNITLSHFGRTFELNDNGVPAADRVLVADEDYLRRYTPFEVGHLWQNVTMSPDFPSVAGAMSSLYPQSGGSEIDGVISADPFALAALLRITGPVPVEGWPEPITADNAARILLFDFYAQLSDERNVQRIDLQAQVANLTWSRLFSGPIPSPATLGSALSGAVRARHLQLWAKRDAEERLFSHLGADGAVSALRGDGFAAVTNNAGANKIEWYLHRDVAYDATVDLDTGAVTSTAILTMQNQAPASGVADYLIANTAVPPAPPGTSVQYLSLYSPLQLTAVSLDGKPLQVFTDRELGRNVYSSWVRVAPGATSTVVATFKGTTKSPKGTYSLELGCQPLVNADQARVTIHLRGSRRVTVEHLTQVGDTLTATEPLSCRRVYSVAAD